MSESSTLSVQVRRIFFVVCAAALLIVQRPSLAQPPSAAQIEAARAYNEAAGGQTFIVAYNGVTIAESYANGGSVNRRQLLASATKGLTGMIGAMAASDGIINLDEPVAVNALTEWQGDPLKSRITYRHLLTMSSGLRELNNVGNWTDYLAAPVDYPGGSTFVYSGDPNIFGLALERRLGGESVVSYMNRRLFTPLGMSSIQWSPGSFTDGHPNLSGGAFLTARDWAKYGKFILQMHTGEWTGPNLVSQENFDKVFQGNPSHPAYGFYWWLKNEVSPELAAIIDANNNDQFTRQIAPLINDPIIPDDFLMAAGAYEQRLYVIPSLDLFVLRNGPTSAAGRFVDTEFLNLLLAVPSPGAAALLGPAGLLATRRRR
jgi:CubicO group peptidase (beta-lactamase class C family)